MIRYAITSGEYAGRKEALIALAREWAEAGVEFVQLREKAMGTGELMEVARAMVGIFRASGGRTKLLVNGRGDVAVAAEAAGVHLTSRAGELTAEQIRRVFAAAGVETAVVSVACHTLEEVVRAAGTGVDLILFGPVFEKRVDGETVASGTGIQMLLQACDVATGIPLLALGGVTAENACECMRAGAAGIAGIRLFAQDSGKAISKPSRP